MFDLFVLFNVYVILQYNKLSIVLSSEHCILQSQKANEYDQEMLQL